MLTGLLWLPPAAADELDASAPYSTQSPGGYTDTGKQQVILSFYNEQGTGQCTGNGCGDADVPPPSDVPHGPPPGIEPQAGSVPLHVMMSPIGGGLQKSLNDVISKALGVNNTGPLGAALVRGAHIDDWVGHQMPQAEAGIKDQVTRIWRGGRFFSHKQLDAMDTKLSALTGRINSGHFGPTDLTDIVIHVPASHDLTRNAISQQLATVIANYQAMSDFCQNGDFCNWHFDKNGYLNSYQALAEAAEEPDYELYLVTIESNVDAADRALTACLSGLTLERSGLALD